MASKDEDILKQALEDYDNAYMFQRSNIEDAYEDLRFRRGRPEDQWTQEALKIRGDRPCLTINGIPQFIRQVTGDMRQMRPAIKVNPVDSRGDPKTAEVMAGMMRYIENRSFAKHIYTTGADSQVTSGIGHWQVTSEYASNTTFNQELRIVGIEDSVAVLWDPDSVLPTREDAMFCHVPVDISRNKFKKQWPEATAEGFAYEFSHAAEGWYSNDSVRVSAYWVKKPIKRSLVLMPDGAIDDITEQVKGYDKTTLSSAMQFYKSKGMRLEQRDGFQVCRYLVTANEILETTEWPGPDIPIVPVLGEEVRIGREVYRHGVVRYARDPQRMVNYYASADAELTALQPKAPYMATLKQVENHLDLWEQANTANLPYLLYDADPLAGGPPQRVAPPQASQAIQLGKAQALEDMKRVIGIYDAGLGQKSNETSGVAINARDRQSDTGTFVYIDNFNMAIQRTGQILLGLIPYIYDTERRIRIIGSDGTEDMVDINKPIMEGGQEKVQHDVTVGSYDVTLDVGPSFSTRRQEAQEGMKAFLQAFPEAAPVIGDLYAKGQDWQYASEIAERLQAVLPPPIQQLLEKNKLANNPNAEPDPEQIQRQQEMQKQQQAQDAQIQAALQEVMAKAQQATANAAKADADAEKAKVELERAKVELAKAMVPEPAEQPEQVDPRQQLMGDIELSDKAATHDHMRRMQDMEFAHSQADLHVKARNDHRADEEKKAKEKSEAEAKQKQFESDGKLKEVAANVDNVAKQIEELLKQQNAPIEITLDKKTGTKSYKKGGREIKINRKEA